MWKYKVKGFVIGVLVVASMQVLAAQNIRSGVVKDHYHNVVVIEPYYVEVCGEQTSMAGDVAVGALWGAILGAVAGDALDDNGGRIPGAIIGGMIGAKHEENKGDGSTNIVCRTEQRKTKTAKRQYSHSTIYFTVQGSSYELDFIRNDR